MHTSVRLTESQREKLRQIAAALSTTPHRVMGQLVDNAVIQPVEKFEAVPQLPGNENSRSAQVLAGQSATAVIG